MATVQVTPDSDAVVSEIQIAAPPQRVFDALTDPKQVMTWWTTEECRIEGFTLDPRRGGKWTYDTASTHMNLNGVSKFHCEGEIIEYDPPRLLAYTWIANWHEEKSRRTVVRYDLTPEAGGTHIKVTHNGLANEPVCRKDYSGGWPGVLKDLKIFAEKTRRE
jgi:uncharacterized protein YndB with AHSA1/START domain